MARILLYGTDRRRFRDARALLRQGGHEVVTFLTLEDWESMERKTDAHLVVAAAECPTDVLAFPPRSTRGFAPPLLFIHREIDRPDHGELDDRLVDRIVSPFRGEELLARVDALVGVYRYLSRHLLPGGATEPDRRTGIWHRFVRPHSAPALPAEPRRQLATRLAEWSDHRDTFEVGHVARVGTLCAQIGETLGVDESEATILYQAAALHDIGKVAVPVDVLHHDGPLDENQRRLIQIHPRRGAALVRLLDPDDEVAQAVFCHHERPDGSGYMGYKSEEIPRVAAILAVAECFDAMISSRVGRRLSPLAALERLETGKGRLHDTDSVEALAARLRPRPDVIPLSPPMLRPAPPDEESSLDRMPPK